MDMKYFDAHCHVQLSQYDEDREAVIERMKEAGVGGLVVGVDLASSRKAVELAAQHEHLFAAIGLHPNDVPEEVFDEAAFDELARHPKVRAIGECGLDYYRPNEPDKEKIRQKEIFEKHIELAVRHDKPLMIHSRPSKGSQDAYWDTIEIIESKKREYGDTLRGDMHFFVGGVEEARKFVELGFTMSYTALVTYVREYDEVIRSLPLASILSETDAPWIAPPPNRGKRNEPTAVRETVRAIAEIRGENEDKIRQQILQNAAKMFSFSL